MNAAQVFNTSGGGYGVRIKAPVASSIKKFYTFANAITGTPSTIQGEIRNERSGLLGQPGTTVRQAAVTATWGGGSAAAKHWLEFDFSSVPYTPAVGESLWLNVFNGTATPASHYPQFLTTTGFLSNVSSIGGGGGTPTFADNRFAWFTTTTGWSTAGGAVNGSAIVEFADGTIAGQPFTRSTSAFYASNQRERGIYIGALDSPLWCSAISFGPATAATGIRIYDASQAPGSTPSIASFNLGSDANQVNDKIEGTKAVTPFLLPAGRAMRCTLTYNVNTVGLTVFNIEGSTDFADILLCGAQGNTIGYATIDNGAGGWTDDKSAFGGVCLIVSQTPPCGVPRSREFLGSLSV